VASIDVHVLDHAVGTYRLLRTLAPEDGVSVLEAPVRIKVPWSELSVSDAAMAEMPDYRDAPMPQCPNAPA
jgi:hypothetical protein